MVVGIVGNDGLPDNDVLACRYGDGKGVGSVRGVGVVEVACDVGASYFAVADVVRADRAVDDVAAENGVACDVGASHFAVADVVGPDRAVEDVSPEDRITCDLLRRDGVRRDRRGRVATRESAAGRTRRLP